MKITLKILEAFDGDCLLIKFGNQDNFTNILIDGGINRTYVKSLRNEFENISRLNQHINLLIVTHIHDDHIGGIVEFFRDPSISKEIVKKVWFNSKIILGKYAPYLENKTEGIEINKLDSTKMGIRSGNTLEGELRKLSCWEESLILFKEEYINYTINGAKITVLSPSYEGIKGLRKVMGIETDESGEMAARKLDYDFEIEELLCRPFIEDDSDTNRSSIALIFEYGDKKLLFLGDSHPTDIVKSLRNLGYSEENKINVDFVKVSHHGSKKNTSIELLNLVECNNFIISTDGSKHGLPNKECLARIIKSRSNVNLYFNYDIHKRIFSKSEMEQYKFTCITVRELEV